jgi:hypothetical protein
MDCSARHAVASAGKPCALAPGAPAPVKRKVTNWSVEFAIEILFQPVVQLLLCFSFFNRGNN